MTDRCNFSCKHCFVNRAGRELTFTQCKKIIDDIVDMKQFKRVNLAGGEPLLVPYLQELIDYIVSKGLACSIITNGWYLTESFIRHNKTKLSMIGISIDSMQEDINRQIGRKTIKNLHVLCDAIKDQGICLKINICISRLNKGEDFSTMLDHVKPDRLKLLMMLPSPHAQTAKDQSITVREFQDVCRKLSAYHPICEDNEYMTHHYWIVDSSGHFGKDNLHKHDSALDERLIRRRPAFKLT